MSKKAFFILLPIIAILFSINSNTGYILPCPHETSATNEVTAKSKLPYSFELNKNNNKQARYKIRIKACDDFSAIEIIQASIPVARVYYCARETFLDRGVCFESTHFPGDYLRGPPELI